MTPTGMPEIGAMVVEQVYTDPRCPEFCEIHWGFISGYGHHGEVEITNETTNEIYYMPACQVEYVPGYEPKAQGSVWD